MTKSLPLLGKIVWEANVGTLFQIRPTSLKIHNYLSCTQKYTYTIKPQIIGSITKRVKAEFQRLVKIEAYGAANKSSLCIAGTKETSLLLSLSARKLEDDIPSYKDV